MMLRQFCVFIQKKLMTKELKVNVKCTKSFNCDLLLLAPVCRFSCIKHWRLIFKLFKRRTGQYDVDNTTHVNVKKKFFVPVDKQEWKFNTEWCL